MMGSVWFLIALFLSLSSVTSAQGDSGWRDSYRQDFNYDPNDSKGPSNWADVAGDTGDLARYADELRNVNRWGNRCSDNRNIRPSPVNLFQITENCEDIHEPLTRQIDAGDCGREDVEFAITPGGLKAYYPLYDSSCRRPTLTFSGRRDSYTLIQMELRARSEHALDGRRYDAELQLVHMGTGREEGRLSIISVMFEASASEGDVETEWLLNEWESVASVEADMCAQRRELARSAPSVEDYQKAHEQKNSKQAAKDQDDAQPQRDLQFTPSPCRTDRFGKGCEPWAPRRKSFPYNLWPSIWYFLYQGSLTAPPCTDVVQWRIIDVPRRITMGQYRRMTRLLSQSRNDKCELDTIISPQGENARPLQETQQAIQHCTIRDFGHFVYDRDEQ